MGLAILIWLIGSLLGGVIVALPDRGERLFSISEAHGPSALDAAGALIMIGGWLVFIAALWRRRAIVRRTARGPLGGLLLVTLGLGLGLLIASVASDFAYWWALGAAMLAIVQLTAAYLARSS